jgi:hypothetical protein
LIKEMRKELAKLGPARKGPLKERKPKGAIEATRGK